jgi:hypothetical protein
MEPDDFDFGINPDDFAELEERFDHVISDSENGYILELLISRINAKGLLKTWIQACLGDTVSMRAAMHEYGRIMQELKDAMADDDRP